MLPKIFCVMLSLEEKMMMAKKKAEKMLCNEMQYAENHHLFADVDRSMLMGFFGNDSSSSQPRLGPFDEAIMMRMNDLGSMFVNKTNDEKMMLNKFVELGLAKNVHGMHIGDERESFCNQQAFGCGFNGHFLDENGGFSKDSVYDYGKIISLKNPFSMGHFLDNKCENGVIREPYVYNDYTENAMELRRQQMRGYCSEGFEMQSPCVMMNRPVLDDSFCNLEPYGVNGIGDIGVSDPLYSPTTMNRVERSFLSTENRAAMEAFGCEDKFNIQGKSVHFVVGKRNDGKKKSKSHEKKAALCSQAPYGGIIGSCEFGLQPKSLKFMHPVFSSLADLQGNIHMIAKEQLGCRLLQRLIDEGTYQDVQLIFQGTIHHVSKLMMEPFGNYLVQKLLDVCNEGQRTQIVLMVTKRPGELIKISKNIYGTRVVQKIIETINTSQQISLVARALQPGFLDLVKDLNGKHVVQRCLQCLTEEQNKFIFDGAAKFCVDIATDRHGCCVLNYCIDHSSGRNRDKLVAEICANGFALAQQPFGNYVIQYIIQLKIPSAVVPLLSEFEGHFVHLAMQKFSSHVVEQCLKCYEQSQPRIIRELLSVPHFEQLLQDPFANYVIQSALQVIKGPLRVLLVQAVKPHKILRASPYCKRIFSRSLLNK